MLQLCLLLSGPVRALFDGANAWYALPGARDSSRHTHYTHSSGLSRSQRQVASLASRPPCLWRRRQVDDWRRAVASDGGSAAPGSDQRPRISIATKMQGPGVDSVWPEDPKRPRDTRHAIGCFPARQPGSSAQCFVPSARVCQVGGGPPVHDSLAGPAQQATEACSS